MPADAPADAPADVLANPPVDEAAEVVLQPPEQPAAQQNDTQAVWYRPTVEKNQDWVSEFSL